MSVMKLNIFLSFFPVFFNLSSILPCHLSIPSLLLFTPYHFPLFNSTFPYYFQPLLLSWLPWEVQDKWKSVTHTRDRLPRQEGLAVPTWNGTLIKILVNSCKHPSPRPVFQVLGYLFGWNMEGMGSSYLKWPREHSFKLLLFCQRNNKNAYWIEKKMNNILMGCRWSKAMLQFHFEIINGETKGETSGMDQLCIPM